MVLMQGNEAVARGALDAGVRFFAGYPITPSTEIAEIMSIELPKVGGKFLQMEDEMGSLAAVIGASLAGAKAMTATSGPGFSLMQEHLGYAYMTEVPCLVVDVMRGGPSTGLPTHPSQGDVMQARWGCHGDHPAIALAASSVVDCYTLTVRAINLAERFRMPVILLSDAVVGHMREDVTLPEEIEVVDREKPHVPYEWYYPYDDSTTAVAPLAPFGTGFRFHVTGLTHDRAGFATTVPAEVDRAIRNLKRKMDRFRHEIIQVEHTHLADAEVVVAAYGLCARAAEAAAAEARQRGYLVGFINLKTIWPFCFKLVQRVAETAKAIIVPELNLGQLVREFERAVCDRAQVVPINRVDGEAITPRQILDVIGELARPGGGA
jgi:2-oxoglutarate ferredoxin oxidoreductase subunit alpha